MRLLPFTAERLLDVGRRVRSLYPAQAPDRVAERADDRFLEGLVNKVTEGFGGKVAVAPRLFLRELVDVLDRVDQHPDYDPAEHYRLEVHEEQLTPEELAALRGMMSEVTSGAGARPTGAVAVQSTGEAASQPNDAASETRSRRRLDG